MTLPTHSARRPAAATWLGSGWNPSTADESRLDPTLWRLRAYAHRFGFRAFTMLNLFAYRATDPRVLRRAADPMGPDNDRYLLEVCRQAALVVCCWGTDGEYRGRDRQVLELLEGHPLARAGAHQAGPSPASALPQGHQPAHPFRRQPGRCVARRSWQRGHRQVNRRLAGPSC